MFLKSNLVPRTQILGPFGPPLKTTNDKSEYFVEVSHGCQASAIIYQNTRANGDYQLIIAINVSIRQLTAAECHL